MKMFLFCDFFLVLRGLLEELFKPFKHVYDKSWHVEWFATGLNKQTHGYTVEVLFLSVACI